MTTLPTIVMDQAADVIRGLQATVAALQLELSEARRTIDDLRAENRKLIAKGKRERAALRYEGKLARW